MPIFSFWSSGKIARHLLSSGILPACSYHFNQLRMQFILNLSVTIKSFIGMGASLFCWNDGISSLVDRNIRNHGKYRKHVDLNADAKCNEKRRSNVIVGIFILFFDISVVLHYVRLISCCFFLLCCILWLEIEK